MCFFTLLFYLVLIYLIVHLLYLYFRLERGPLLISSPSWKGAVLGHRGCRVNGANNTPSLNLNIPENSLLAMAWARDHGAEGIEIDIQSTVDSTTLVLHDDTLERTHEGEGYIKNRTYEYIKHAKFRKVGDKEYIPNSDMDRFTVDAASPTLEQTVIYCKQRNLKLMIELKEHAFTSSVRSEVSRLYHEYNLYDIAFVASFNPIELYRLRSEHPYIPTCFLFCKNCVRWYGEDGSTHMQLPFWINFYWVRWILDWFLCTFGSTVIPDFLGCSLIGPHSILVNPDMLAEAKIKKLCVYVWVVNDPYEAAFLCSKGCLIGTDRADLVCSAAFAARNSTSTTTTSAAAVSVPNVVSPRKRPSSSQVVPVSAESETKSGNNVSKQADSAEELTQLINSS